MLIGMNPIGSAPISGAGLQVVGRQVALVWHVLATGTVRWRGNAPAVAQVTRATPLHVGTGDVFVLTINGKSVTFTAATSTVANVTAGLVAAWNASTHPEMEEITAADATTHLNLTADTKGKPFTVTGSVRDADGNSVESLAVTTTTNSSGPNDWSVGANWSTGGAPGTGDTVVIDVPVSILYGLSQSSVTLASLTVSDSFGAARVGLPESTGSYAEYRGTYLAISATTITVRCASQRIKLDTGTAQTTLFVLGTGKGKDLESGLECLLFKGTHASNVVNVSQGSVGIAVFGGESATVATLRLGAPIDSDKDGENDELAVRCGTGASLTTVDQMGGESDLASNVTTLTLYGGTATIRGTVTLTTGHVWGGKLYYMSSGTITTLNVFKPGVADFSRDIRTRTVTTTRRFAGGTIYDPFLTITFTSNVSDQWGP